MRFLFPVLSAFVSMVLSGALPQPAKTRGGARGIRSLSTNQFSSKGAWIWSVADLSRGDFKQSQYGRIILPFTLLRRLECVLEPTKDKVLADLVRSAVYEKLRGSAPQQR